MQSTVKDQILAHGCVADRQMVLSADTQQLERVIRRGYVSLQAGKNQNSKPDSNISNEFMSLVEHCSSDKLEIKPS